MKKTKAELDIIARRNTGKKTNLMRSEFQGITDVRYGAKLCDNDAYGANLSLVTFVISRPNDFKLRSLIRNTWAKEFQAQVNKSRLYFVIGQMGNDSSEFYLTELLIAMEDRQFGDLIQFGYVEDYYRLTIKSMAIIRWANVYCPLAVNILKVDSDALVNYDNLIKLCDQLKFSIKNLTETDKESPPFQLYGNIWRNVKVLRNKKNKFYTSVKDFSEPTYPIYSGSIWLLNGRFHSLFLYLASFKLAMPAFLWEDVYLTGIVPRELIRNGVPYRWHQISGFLFNVEPNRCRYLQATFITEHLTVNNLETIWTEVNNQSIQCNL